MKHLFSVLFIAFYLCAFHFQAQAQVVIDRPAEFMTIDSQGNLYLVQDATLYKYASDGRLLSSYTNNMLGHISSVDADNPLKVMLFYQDAGCILFLDDHFAPIGDQIDLFSKGLHTISLATYSTKNNIILYDDINSELIIMDLNFNVKEKIQNNFDDFHPYQLFDVNEKMIVMQDKEQGTFFFDDFGTFEKNIVIASEFPLQIIGDIIYYLKDGQLKSYHFTQLEGNVIGNVPEGTKQALVYHNSFIFMDPKGAFILSK